MIIFLFLIFIGLILEAFFTGAETAFISVNFLKLMHLIEKKNKRAMQVHDILKKPDRLLTTTLLGTNLSVVLSAACATAVFERIAPGCSAFLTTVVMTPVSFIFCQLLPKTVLRHKANRAALYMAAPLHLSEKIFLPFVNFFTFFANSIAALINPGGLKKNPFLTKDEIKSLIKDISREGILEAHEKEAIDKIFDMTQTRAADIMVPVRDIVSFNIADSLEAVEEKARLQSFTRYPVFKDKDLAGVLNIFDIFYHAQSGWQGLLRPFIRIEHDESIDKVFAKMRPDKDVVAAVYKGPEMLGIVTMEDLMEEITSKLTSARR